MKFSFVTCVELGLSCMEEIYRIGGELDLVITLRDELARRKSGRVYIDDFCKKRGIKVVKVQHINDDEAVQAVRGREIDWLFIIGWSQIAGRCMLRIPKRGVLGIHPTLLPVGRGRSPIPWAILKGLKETGVTLFQLDEGVDTGPILFQERLPIAADETATTLYDRISAAHRTLISRVWQDLVADRLMPLQQDSSQASVWPARAPKDGRIDLAMTVEEVDRLVRATTHPYPGAFVQNGEKVLKVWAGKIGQGDQPTPEGGLRLVLRDGVFDALVYEWTQRPGVV